MCVGCKRIAEIRGLQSDRHIASTNETSKDVLQQELSKEMVAIMDTPEEVVGYTVQYVAPEADVERIHEFGLKNTSDILSSDQQQKLQDILLNTENYHLSGVSLCNFSPEFAFQFQHGKDNLIVLFSRRCKQALFVLKGKEVLTSFNIEESGLLAFVQSLFPIEESIH